MRRLFPFILTMLFAVGAAGGAAALELEAAKAQGLVGEQSDGYLGSVQPSAESNALVASINEQRKVKYLEIATKNGTSLTDVEALAGKKAMEMTAPGGFIRVGAGAWKKK